MGDARNHLGRSYLNATALVGDAGNHHFTFFQAFSATWVLQDGGRAVTKLLRNDMLRGPSHGVPIACAKILRRTLFRGTPMAHTLHKAA